MPWLILSLAMITQQTPEDFVPLDVRLEGSADFLRIADPLLVRVVVENKGTETVVVPPLLCGENGGIYFECVKPRKTVVQRVPAARQDWCMLGSPVTMASGEIRTMYEALFLDGSEFVFDLPGTYQLRANLVSGKVQISSDWVNVFVAPTTPREELATIKEALDVVRWEVDANAIGGSSEKEKLREVERRLTRSSLKRMLDWKTRSTDMSSTELAKLRDASSESGDSVTADILTHILAWKHVKTGNWPLAAKEIQRIRPGAWRDSLEYELKVGRGDAEKRK